MAHVLWQKGLARLEHFWIGDYRCFRIYVCFEFMPVECILGRVVLFLVWYVLADLFLCELCRK